MRAGSMIAGMTLRPWNIFERCPWCGHKERNTETTETKPALTSSTGIPLSPLTHYMFRVKKVIGSAGDFLKGL